MAIRFNSGSITGNGATDGYRIAAEDRNKPLVALIQGTIGTAEIAFEVSDEDTPATYVPMLDPASGAARVPITAVGAVGIDAQPDTYIRAAITGAGGTNITIKFLQR